jgi:predicted P-loop ATPase
MKTGVELLSELEAGGLLFEYDVRGDRLFTIEDWARRPFTEQDMHRLSSLYQPAGFGSSALIYSHIRANARQVDPILDWVRSERWDGVDRMTALGNSFTCGVDFTHIIRAFMIGCMAKAIRSNKDALQNPVLVLVGGQGMGKSQFVRWLASGFPSMYSESVLAVKRDGSGSKDTAAMAAGKFIIELPELQATISASGRSALKAFLTSTTVSYRAPYARTISDRPVLASYVATANNAGNGLLNDATGSRRYRIVEVEGIDWGYTSLDLQQLWAQADFLFTGGATYSLPGDVETVLAATAVKYMRTDIYKQLLEKHFNPSTVDGMTVADILTELSRVSPLTLNVNISTAAISEAASSLYGKTGELFHCAAK